jgi:hypothetical protein
MFGFTGFEIAVVVELACIVLVLLGISNQLSGR